MSLFRNRNKSFEDKLSKQFEDLEYKPSESLWDKISTNVPEDGFEGAVSEKVNTFEPKPKPETWEQIEAQLPPEHRRSNRKLYYWLPSLILLFMAGTYFGYQLSQPQTQLTQLENNTPSAAPATITLPEKTDRPAVETKQKTESAHTTTSAAVPVTQLEKTEPTPAKQALTEPSAVSVHQTIPSTAMPAKQKAITSTAIVTSGQLSADHSAKKQQPVASSHTSSDKSTPVVSSTEPVKENHPATDAIVPPVSTDVPPTTGITSANEPKQEKQSPITTTPASKEQDKGASSSAVIAGAAIAGSTTVVNNNTTSAPDTTTVAPETTPAPSVKDSLPLNPASTTENKEEKTELTRFSITILTGAQYCFNSLSAPQQSTINFDANIALRQKLETPAIDWNGAFLLDYAVNNKWRISSGIIISNFSQNFQYAITDPTNNPGNKNQKDATITNPNDSIINGNTYNNRIKYSWTEIPLFVTYVIPLKGKLGIDLTGGISYAFINGVDASYVSYDNIGVLLVKDKNDFPGVKNNFFVHVNPTLTFKANEMISVGIAPTFKYSITSITANENWVQQHPYFVGLSLSLRKCF